MERIMPEDLVHEEEHKWNLGPIQCCYIEKNLELDTPIYRYTQIPYVISDFENHSLHFSNRSNMLDLRESGHFLRSELFKAFQIVGGDNLDNKKHNERLNECWGMQYHQHISCWTLDQVDSNKKHIENSLMWMSYAKRYGAMACRIKTSIRRMLESIIKCPTNLFVSQIEYIDYSQRYKDSFFVRLFSKHHIYFAENEVRLLLLTNGEDINHISINNNYIEEVILSPFSDIAEQKFLKQYLAERIPNFEDRIHYSKGMEKL